MKTCGFLLAALVFPIVASAGVGRGEAAKKEDACEQAKTKAQATCASGSVAELGRCDCVERQTTLYLKNWRCAVEAKCDDGESELRPGHRGAASRLE